MVAQIVKSSEVSLQPRRPRLDPQVGSISWGREWLSSPGSFLGGSHGQRSLASYSPWGCKESDMTERLTEGSTGASGR